MKKAIIIIAAFVFCFSALNAEVTRNTISFKDAIYGRWGVPNTNYSSTFFRDGSFYGGETILTLRVNLKS